MTSSWQSIHLTPSLYETTSHLLRGDKVPLYMTYFLYIASIYFEVLMTYKYIESTVLRQDENTPVEVLSLLYCKYDSMFNLLIKCHYRNDFVFYFVLMWRHIDGLVQERRISSALAMELRLSCTKPLTCVVCNTSTDHASLMTETIGSRYNAVQYDTVGSRELSK